MRTFSRMMWMVGLVCAGFGLGAQAQSGGPVTWSFVPVSSVMPTNLPDGAILAVGGQGTLIVEASPTNRAVHLVHNNQSTLLFTPGDPAPGGGTFGSYHSSYVVSTDRVLLLAYIDLLGTSEIRCFRWETGTLAYLSKPDDVTYDLNRTDSAGKFLAYRETGDQSREYWITDGVSNSASLVLQGHYESGSQLSYSVIGITTDGSFLIYEDFSNTPPGCNNDSDTYKIYFRGSRNTLLAESIYTWSSCEGGVEGGTWLYQPGANSSGNALVGFRDVTGQSRLRLYDSAGVSTTVADNSVFFDLGGGYLTYHPQAIFYAKLTDADDYKLYVGPTANDRFGGDFVGGFGQSGQVDYITRFHESGVALVGATLADGSNVLALGRTSAGGSPTLTSGEPPPGTNHQAYSFQFTATGSPAPTFNVAAGDLPPGLTLAPDGLLSGTPTNSGDFPITLRAANGINPDATNNYTLVIRPRLPVIFMHGIAGSVLKSGNHTIWPSIFPQDVADLNLQTGPADTEAVDIIRQYDVGGLGKQVEQFYAPFITYMTNQDYTEFNLEGDRSRMTNFFLQNQFFSKKPDLFTFPYDWRKPNASHMATLHTYIQRIRALHGGAKVNLVVHSMGGLVMRRYLLEYGTDDIDKVVTVGSPILGAPEVAYRMLTGIFYNKFPVDFMNSRLMKDAIATMPAVHELLPSTLFLQHWGFPVFAENGHDYDGNGLRFEGYDTSQFRSMLDAEAEPFNPALTNVLFHTLRQDDWSGDDGSVKFLQIVGKQAVDDTTVGVTVQGKILQSLILLAEPHPVLQFSRVVSQGDGTVPILSSRRLPALLAPGTLLREIEEPKADKSSADQPPGRAAEHTALMANTQVLGLITEFLDAGTLATPVVPAVAADPQVRPHGQEVTNGPAVLAPDIAVEQPLGMNLVAGVGSTSFGRVPLGNSNQITFTISNVGTTNLTGLAVSVTGTNSADFSVGSLGTMSLMPGEITNVIVTYAPVAGTAINRSAVLHIASNDADENPFDIALTGTTPPGSKRISILGSSYLTVIDGEGRTNTRLSEIAAQQIPGVDFQYGGDEPWMNIETSSDHELTLANAGSTEPLEVEVVEFSNAGTPVSLQRYRFAPGTNNWRMALLPGQVSDLKVDQDHDGNFEPEEAVAATHSSAGAAVDLTAPGIAMELSLTNGHIVASFIGTDGVQPAPILRYVLDGGLVQTYTAPLSFPAGSTSLLKIFAEDSAGNTSGLIETAINPSISLSSGTGGTLSLAWPMADGYVLEETDSLGTPWTPTSVQVKRTGVQDGVSLALDSDDQKFYRLRSQQFAR